MSHAPTMLKSDRSVFENAPYRKIKAYFMELNGAPCHFTGDVVGIFIFVGVNII